MDVPASRFDKDKQASVGLLGGRYGRLPAATVASASLIGPSF